MARKFFFVCAGLLMLAVVFQMGAHTAQGQNPGGLRWIGGSAGEPYVATDTQIWVYRNGSWRTLSQVNEPDPPVMASQVLVYDGHLTITSIGGAFQWIEPQQTWVSRGFIPADVTSVQGTTWGAIRAKYKK